MSKKIESQIDNLEEDTTKLMLENRDLDSRVTKLEEDKK